MIIENVSEEKLLESIRKLNEVQKEKLLSFIDSIAKSSAETIPVSTIVDKLRTEAANNNLTEQLLSQILSGSK